MQGRVGEAQRKPFTIHLDLAYGANKCTDGQSPSWRRFTSPFTLLLTWTILILRCSGQHTCLGSVTARTHKHAGRADYLSPSPQTINKANHPKMHSQAGGSFTIHLDGKTGKVARSWVHVKQKGERQGQEI